MPIDRRVATLLPSGNSRRSPATNSRPPRLGGDPHVAGASPDECLREEVGDEFVEDEPNRATFSMSGRMENPTSPDQCPPYAPRRSIWSAFPMVNRQLGTHRGRCRKASPGIDRLCQYRRPKAADGPAVGMRMRRDRGSGNYRTLPQQGRSGPVRRQLRSTCLVIPFARD